MKKIFILVLLLIFFIYRPAYANGLNISKILIQSRDPNTHKVVIKFDISWNNAWKTKINHDAVWVTFRLHKPASSVLNKKLCQLTEGGLNPAGTAIDAKSGLEIYIPKDRKGIFVRPSQFDFYNSISAKNVQVSLDYASGGFGDLDEVYVSALGIEMVYIPKGSFYAGDYNGSTASLHQGVNDAEPWIILNENPIVVSNVETNGYRYVSNNNGGEFPTGATFTIPAVFPKGYSPYYAMKYEVTEGEWVEFINSLPSAEARAHHDLTDGLHKNSDSVKFRNTISCNGSPLVCSTDRPSRGLNFLTWMDLLAFLDWAALRPMTELEYEKMSRGSLISVPGEFAWGSTEINPVTVISGNKEDGTEGVLDAGASAHFDNKTLSGGDSSAGGEFSQGPLRMGILATSSSNRVTAGAGYYGALDLSGNVKEHVVTIGNTPGLVFAGSQGDGILTTLEGSEGNANQPDWPGLDVNPDKGIVDAQGSGFKGGGWDDPSPSLRISDRNEAAKGSSAALPDAGGRGVRTYDGN